MSATIVGISMTVKKPAALSERKFREVARSGFQELAEKWHRDFLGRHFEPTAARRYGYRRRSVKYVARKTTPGRDYRRKNIYGSQHVPNVLTGRLRDALTRSVQIRAFPSRATVRLTGTEYIGRRFPPDMNQPDKDSEIKATTREERRELARTFRDHVTTELNKHRTPEVVKD